MDPSYDISPSYVMSYDIIEKVLNYLDKKSVLAFLSSGKPFATHRIYLYRRFLFDIRHLKYLPPEFKNEVRNMRILNVEENLGNYPNINKIYDIYYSISSHIDPNYKKMVRSIIIDTPNLESLSLMEFENLEILIVNSITFNQKIDMLPPKIKKIIIHSLAYNQPIYHLLGQIKHIEVNSPLFKRYKKSEELKGTQLIINGKEYYQSDFERMPILKDALICVE